MDDRFQRIEDKLDLINDKLTKIQINQRDIVWIKSVAKLIIPAILGFAAWTATSIMEIQSNVATLPVPQQPKYDGRDHVSE